MFDMLIYQHLLMALRVFTFGVWVAPLSRAILVHVVWGEIKLYPLVTLSTPIRPLLSSGMGMVRWHGCDYF